MKTIWYQAFTALFVITFQGILFGQNPELTNPDSQSEELGKVEWYRNYDEAVKSSKSSGKPILILFQEVPGCATCRNYGHKVLSNPLMVEAIENEFTPLAIHNNKGGHDREILKKFNEPSWNNPVVRIVDLKGHDLVKRITGNYSAKALFNAMEKTLMKLKRPIPKYMQILGKEVSSIKLEEKYFSMYCFWSGEKHFGELDGVLKAEAGFMNHKEVVKVTYNPENISEEKLTQYASTGSCKPIKHGDFRFSNKDHLYYLQHSNYKYLPLSTIQKLEINSALGNGQDATNYLSPKQLKWLQQIAANKIASTPLFELDITNAWGKMSNS